MHEWINKYHMHNNTLLNKKLLERQKWLIWTADLSLESNVDKTSPKEEKKEFKELLWI